MSLLDFFRKAQLRRITDVNELEKAVDYVYKHTFDNYKSNTSVIIENIRNFIQENIHD